MPHGGADRHVAADVVGVLVRAHAHPVAAAGAGHRDFVAVSVEVGGGHGWSLGVMADSGM